jgi:hypothetical protein
MGFGTGTDVCIKMLVFYNLVIFPFFTGIISTATGVLKDWRYRENDVKRASVFSVTDKCLKV